MGGLTTSWRPSTIRRRSILSHASAFLAALDGSCRTPIAGYTVCKRDRIRFSGLIVTPDGSREHGVTIDGDRRDATALGHLADTDAREQAFSAMPEEIRSSIASWRTRLICGGVSITPVPKRIELVLELHCGYSPRIRQARYRHWAGGSVTVIPKCKFNIFSHDMSRLPLRQQIVDLLRNFCRPIPASTSRRSTTCEDEKWRTLQRGAFSKAKAPAGRERYEPASVQAQNLGG